MSFAGGAGETWFGRPEPSFASKLRYCAGTIVTLMIVNKMCRGNFLGELEPDQEVYLPFATQRLKRAPNSDGFVDD